MNRKPGTSWGGAGRWGAAGRQCTRVACENAINTSDSQISAFAITRNVNSERRINALKNESSCMGSPKPVELCHPQKQPDRKKHGGDDYGSPLGSFSFATVGKLVCPDKSVVVHSHRTYPIPTRASRTFGIPKEVTNG